MKAPKYLKRNVVVTVMCCVGASAAEAAMVDYTIGDGGLESFDLSYNVSGTTYSTIDGALAGGIAITEATGSAQLGTAPNSFPASYTTLCTDIGGTVYLGSTYGYNQTGFSSQTGISPAWGYDAYNGKLSAPLIINEQQMAIQNAASIFYNNFNDLNGKNTTLKAAMQLAVWDALYNTEFSSNNGQTQGIVQGITYNAKTGNYSLNGGRFTVSSGDQAAINQAALWLLALNGTSTYVGDLLYPDPANQGNADGEPVQELLIRTQDVAPVPEMTTLVAGAMLLLPFGLSTLSVLRRRRAS